MYNWKHWIILGWPHKRCGRKYHTRFTSGMYSRQDATNEQAIVKPWHCAAYQRGKRRRPKSDVCFASRSRD
eukprot:scaffold2767_cov177-Amphora_coffeaeformis.AAC.40